MLTAAMELLTLALAAASSTLTLLTNVADGAVNTVVDIPGNARTLVGLAVNSGANVGYLVIYLDSTPVHYLDLEKADAIADFIPVAIPLSGRQLSIGVNSSSGTARVAVTLAFKRG